LVPSTLGGRLFAAIFGTSGLVLWSSAIVVVGTRIVQKEKLGNLKDHRKNSTLAFYETHMPQQLRPMMLDDNTETTQKDDNSVHSSEKCCENQSHKETKPEWPLSKGVLHDAAPQAPHRRRTLILSLAKPLLLILLGGCLMGKLEGWNFGNSVYFSLVTASTIGFGDFCPNTTPGRLVSLILLPILLACAGDMFATTSVFVLNRRTQRLFVKASERAEWLTPEKVVDMDLDGNGKVSRAEYIVYMLMETGLVDADEIKLLQDQFERFDVTKSGSIEAGDLRAMRKLRKKLQQRDKKQQTKKQQEEKGIKDGSTLKGKEP